MHGNTGHIALPICCCVNNRVHAHLVLAFAVLRKVERSTGDEQDCNENQDALHSRRLTTSRYLP